MKKLIIFLMATLISNSFAGVPWSGLTAITNAELETTDIFAVSDLSAGLSKKILISEVDKRYVSLAATAIAAEMYEHSNPSAPTTINLTTSGTYYQWVSTTTGSVGDYWTHSATTDDLTLTDAAGAGLYKVCSNFSFTGSNSQTLEWAIFKEGTEQDKCHSFRGLGVGSPVGASSICCQLDVTLNDSITLQVTSSASSATVNISHVNVNLYRIGN